MLFLMEASIKGRCQKIVPEAVQAVSCVLICCDKQAAMLLDV